MGVCGWVLGGMFKVGRCMEENDSVSPVGSTAAVWPHPQSVTDHVHSGLLALPRGSSTSAGNPHHLQVQHVQGVKTRGRSEDKEEEIRKAMNQ